MTEAARTSPNHDEDEEFAPPTGEARKRLIRKARAELPELDRRVAASLTMLRMISEGRLRSRRFF